MIVDVKHVVATYGISCEYLGANTVLRLAKVVML